MNKVCLFIATSLLSFNLFANENVISGQQLKVFFLAFGLFSIIILVLLLIFIRKNKKQKAINSDYSMVLRNSQDKNKKLEEKLRRQESACQQIKELASVVENTNNAVIITGTDGKLEWVNEGFEILYGYDLDEFTAEVGNNILTISTNPRAISEGIEHKKSVTYPTYRVNRKGKRIWLQVEFTPITDSSGNIKKFVFVEADVSLYKVNETEILQQVEEVDNQLTISEMKREKMSSKYKIFTDSVNYALRIQNAILPSKDTLDKILGDYFILFRPRDIVSGDFYWVSEYYNKTIIAVADCTGHGVPGAFMSILGSAFLTEIVGQSKELKANEILNELRNIVISSFSKSKFNDEAKDGIDMALCIIDKQEMQIQYSGANNPLYLVREREIIETKPDRMPIGIHPKASQSFTNHKIDIVNGDLLYMFSDGFVDQFGWRNGKKFKYQAFRSLILNLYDIPIKGQRIIMDNTIINWMGELEQIDDILVMGIKV